MAGFVPVNIETRFTCFVCKYPSYWGGGDAGGQITHKNLLWGKR